MLAGWLPGRQASRLAEWLASKHPNIETDQGTKNAKTSKLVTLFVLGWLAEMETCSECRLPIPLLSIVAQDNLFECRLPIPLLSIVAIDDLFRMQAAHPFVKHRGHR